MKKKLSIVDIIVRIIGAGIVIFLVAAWVLPSIGHFPFKGPVNTVYTKDDGNEHYIAIFTSSNSLSIYHYLDETDDFKSIVGVKTVFECTGSFYNPFIGPLHLNPDPSILIWQNYAVYGEGEKSRANITMKPTANYVVNAAAESAITGTFRDTISIGDTFIEFSGKRFEQPQGDKEDFANRIINLFDTSGQEV